MQGLLSFQFHPNKLQVAARVVQNASNDLNAAVADVIAGRPVDVKNPSKKNLAKSQADIMESVKVHLIFTYSLTQTGNLCGRFRYDYCSYCLQLRRPC